MTVETLRLSKFSTSRDSDNTYTYTCTHRLCDPDRIRVVAFLLATGMFIFTTSFPVTPTRNHNHAQLGCITPTDGRVKGVS